MQIIVFIQKVMLMNIVFQNHVKFIHCDCVKNSVTPVKH